MPELYNNLAAALVHGGSDFPPPRHALCVEQAAFASEGAPVARRHGRFGNDEPGRSALTVILGHQIVWNVRPSGPGAGERRHHDPVLQMQSARLDGIEQRGH